MANTRKIMRMIQKARARHEREAWQKARQMAMALTSEMNVSIIMGLFLFFCNIRFFFDRGCGVGRFFARRGAGRGGEAVEGVMDSMDAPRMAEDVQFGTAAQEAAIHGDLLSWLGTGNIRLQ